MLRLRSFPALAAAAAALLLTAGCAAGASAAGGGRYPDIAVVRDGPAAPALSGPLDGGGRLSPAADRGHVVVLNFWGSWCPACRAEAPGLAAAARRFAAAGVRFVGVDVADNQASALAYMRHFRIGYPSVDDPGDAIVLNFHKLVPIAEFPSTLVISRDGRIAARVIGGVTYAELERLIRKVAG
jgi:thiol-disulfide isomerase/thioredoxin